METIQLLELQNDLTFQQLHEQLTDFNPLKVLRMEKYEIRHSNVLAWLLNPQENHQLQDTFLKKCLEKIFLLDDNQEKARLSLIEPLLLAPLATSTVHREVQTDAQRLIDLVIINPQLKTVIFIENKWFSSESKNQLNDYLTFIENKFADYTIIPIYLTLDGDTPSNDAYFILSYEQIEQILKMILHTYRQRLSQPVLQFIENYHETLVEKYYPNEQLIESAYHLYKSFGTVIEQVQTIPSADQFLLTPTFENQFMQKYRTTIDYIAKHGNHLLAYSFQQFITKHFDDAILYATHRSKPHFVPYATNGQFPLREANYWLGESYIIWFEKTSDHRLKIIVEIGPIVSEKRIPLIQYLLNHNISCQKNALTAASRYTRIYTQKIDVNEWTNYRELTEAMELLYFDETLQNVLKQLTHYFMPQQAIANADPVPTIVENSDINTFSIMKEALESWLTTQNISLNDYRISKKKASFVLPLFHQYKEVFGETRENWWWHNGPLLIWLTYEENNIYLTLEIGPIQQQQRLQFVNNLKASHIKLSATAFKEEAKYSRIYSRSIPLSQFTVQSVLDTLHTFYNDEKFVHIIQTLQLLLKTTYEKISD